MRKRESFLKTPQPLKGGDCKWFSAEVCQTEFVKISILLEREREVHSSYYLHLINFIFQFFHIWSSKLFFILLG